MAKKQKQDPGAPDGTGAVRHPKFEVRLYDSSEQSKLGPLTRLQMEKFLGWEDEEKYAARRLEEDGPPPDGQEYRYDEEYTLKDENGMKVKCWNNLKNRDFKEHWAREIAQDILNRNWAGPLNFPGETVNGETFSITRAGSLGSGQHRAIGFILACQIWAKADPKSDLRKRWPDEPVLETLVSLGVSDHPKIIRTLDNVMPRDLTDVFFTSEVFRGRPTVEKREGSRMLARAVDMLWKRTRDPELDPERKYQTHSESLQFFDRHKKLQTCVEEMFKLNKERGISLLKLSAGQCSALFYLMASSETSGEAADSYRNMDNPSEKKLNWDQWDRSLEFWTLLSTKALPAVDIALGKLVESEAIGGRGPEKLAVLSRAWAAFQENRRVVATDVDLSEEYVTHPAGTPKAGRIEFKGFSDFGGIDLGDEPTAEEPEKTPTPAELKKRAEGERKRRAEEIAAKVEKERETRVAAEDSQPELAPNPPGVKGPRKPPAPVPLEKPLHKREDEAAPAAGKTPPKGKVPAAEKVAAAPASNGDAARRPLRGRKKVEAAQTEKARLADEEKAKEQAAITQIKDEEE